MDSEPPDLERLTSTLDQRAGCILAHADVPTDLRYGKVFDISALQDLTVPRRQGLTRLNGGGLLKNSVGMIA